MMRVSSVLLVAVVVEVIGVIFASELSHRDERFLFTANPIVCDGDAGHQGACLPYFQCDVYEGVTEGTCKVMGQCCVVKRSCGETSPARITYFTSANAYDDTCSVSITTSTKISAPDICQLHVTLDKLKLSEPDADGACTDQYLKVVGGNKNSIKVCGVGNKQTLVVDVEGKEGPFEVSVVNVNGNADPASEWEVKVVQVPCNSDELAPSGCDQYVTGIEGEVMSFNYDTKASTKLHDGDLIGSRHLQESYTICVRPEEGYCRIRWTVPSEEYAFTLNGNLVSDDTLPWLPVFQAGINNDCTFTDYLVFSDATEEGFDEPIYIICGSGFPEAVISGSFKIRMEANGEELNDEEIDNRGFHLLYEQLKCM